MVAFVDSGLLYLQSIDLSSDLGGIELILKPPAFKLRQMLLETPRLLINPHLQV